MSVAAEVVLCCAVVLALGDALDVTLSEVVFWEKLTLGDGLRDVTFPAVALGITLTLGDGLREVTFPAVALGASLA